MTNEIFTGQHTGQLGRSPVKKEPVELRKMSAHLCGIALALAELAANLARRILNRVDIHVVLTRAGLDDSATSYC